MGDPQHAAPVIHVTGTNGKGSTAQMISRLLGRERAHRRHLHEPAPRARQRADQPQRRTDLRRGLRRADRRGRRPRSDRRAPSELLRDHDRRGVPMVRRRRRRRDGDRGRPARPVGRDQRRRRARSPSSPTSAWTTTSSRDRRSRTSPREKAGIIKPRSRHRGRRDPSRTGRRSSRDAGGATMLVADDDFEVDEQSRWPSVVGCSTSARPTTIYTDVYLPLHGAHQGTNAAVALVAVETFFAAPLAEDVVHRRVGRGRDARTLRGARPPAADDRRRGAQPDRGRHLRRRSSSTTSIPRAAACWWSARCATPSEMLAALRADEFDIVFACTAPSPRGVPATDVADAARRAGLRRRRRRSTPSRRPASERWSTPTATTPSWSPAASTPPVPPVPSCSAPPTDPNRPAVAGRCDTDSATIRPENAGSDDRDAVSARRER